MTPRLVTDRLILRGWREDDKPAYAALNADPEVMRHFPSTLTGEQSDDMVDRMARRWDEYGHGLWAIEVRDTGAFIGFVGLAAPSWTMPFTPCIEVGWRLARHAWGNGFAPEAAVAALRWGFAELDPPNDEFVSFTTTLNAKSRRVMEKVGLTHDPADDFDHPMLPDWHERRHVLYRIGRERFLQLHG